MNLANITFWKWHYPFSKPTQGQENNLMCDRLQIYCAELLTKAKKREILNCRCNANILKMKVLDKICQYCNTNTFKHSDEEGSPFAKMDFSIQLFSQKHW